ncbi:MAG: hypothetical protein HYZ71_10605 [Deltaproteobacteria bacterium]|nr:hypothetical protein [Deltaproteobacteria bacterium]
MRFTISLLLLFITIQAVADVAIPHKKSGRYFVAFMKETGRIEVKACLGISRSRPLRECQGEPVSSLPIADFDAAVVGSIDQIETDPNKRKEFKELLILREELEEALNDGGVLNEDEARKQIETLSRRIAISIFLERVFGGVRSSSNEIIDSSDLVAFKVDEWHSRIYERDSGRVVIRAREAQAKAAAAEVARIEAERVWREQAPARALEADRAKFPLLCSAWCLKETQQLIGVAASGPFIKGKNSDWAGGWISIFANQKFGSEEEARQRAHKACPTEREWVSKPFESGLGYWTWAQQSHRQKNQVECQKR